MNVWATFPHFARFLVLGSMIWGIFLLARYWVSRRNKHEQILGHSHPTWEELTEAVRAYGRNSASVVHLYGGMRHFKSWFHLRTSPDEPSPIVGYVALDHQNVVLTDPLCRDFQIKAILNEFARHTQMEGKDSVLFAIDQKTADRAAELGFGILKIGQEAHFDLPNYDASQLNPKILSAVRQAAKKGVSVREVPWSEIEDNYKLRQELDQVLEEWLQSRRGERLQLLSEVSPFKQGSAKRYFLAEQEGRVTSYLACSPIFVDHGFYLHDTIRRPTTINGTTEMLYIQALQMLKASGVKFASLGVAPMAGLGEPGINADYPWVNRVMNWVFENHDTLYRFKTLHRFKAKFNPTYEAPSYIAFYPPKFKIAYALTVATLFNPRGFLGDLTHKWRRWQEGDQLPRPLVSLLEPSILTLSRPVPFTFREILSRCKFTFLMLFLNVYT
ncbi:MAG: phosphatidylglycerol lysyltransferase domain-containing protein, partial [Bdellovibrionota bacterium]